LYVATGDMEAANALYESVGFTEVYKGYHWQKKLQSSAGEKFPTDESFPVNFSPVLVDSILKQAISGLIRGKTVN